MKMYNPPHPGKLLNEYLKGGNISISRLADRIGVARKTISEIVNGRARITPQMARKLAKALNTSPGIWLRLQQQRDEWEVEHLPNDDLEYIKPFEMGAD